MINLLDMILVLSRAGATISVLLLRKIDKEDTLKVSSLINVPTVFSLELLRT